MIRFTNNGDILEIFIRGDFTFKAQEKFKDCFREATSDTKQLIVNLEQVNYLDSAGLGTLIECREHAIKHKIEPLLHVRSENEQLKLILKKFHFDKFFEIIEK